MEAEETPTVTAIVAVTTVTVAATGSTPPSPAEQSAVSLSGDLQQKQVVVVASKKRPHEESTAAQTGGKKPRMRTKSMPIAYHIASGRSNHGGQAETKEVTLVTDSSNGSGSTESDDVVPITKESKRRKNGPGKRGPSIGSKAEQISLTTGNRIAVNLESDDVVPITKESKRRKNGPGKRGPSTGSKAEQIRLTTGNRIAVNLDPEHGRPVDKGVSSLLSNECGKIVREKCPTVHETWTKISRDVKHNLRKEVEVNFDVDVQCPSIVHYLNKLMGKVYREFKCELHKHYKKMRSLEEALDKPPKAMIARNDPDQWKCLCKHFSEEKFKKKSETNAKNRAGKEYEHCGGSRPHGLYFQDKVQEGSKFPAIEAFRVTHLKKGSNDWISNKAQEQYDKMILKEEAYLQELAEKHLGVPIKELPISPEVGIEILKEVLSVKPKQPVRGLGAFWVKETSTSSIIEELEEVYAELERERAIRAKIQGKLNAAYERLSQLDPNFEAPQLHLVDPSIEAPQLDLNGDEQHQTHSD